MHLNGLAPLWMIRCRLRMGFWLSLLHVSHWNSSLRYGCGDDSRDVLYETGYTNDITRYVPTVTRNLSRNALRELGNALH